MTVTVGGKPQRVISQRRTCAARVPAVVGGLTGFGCGARPLVGGIRVGAAPRLGVVAIATVHFSAALPAAACPAGARAVAAAPARDASTVILALWTCFRPLDLFFLVRMHFTLTSAT